MTLEPGFYAPDLADGSVASANDPTQPSGVEKHATHGAGSHANTPPSRNALGWVLLVALALAVCIAISLAIQLEPSGATGPEPPPVCGGLYSECCDEQDAEWDPCSEPCDEGRPEREFDGREGLFDEETEFAGETPRANC